MENKSVVLSGSVNYAQQVDPRCCLYVGRIAKETTETDLTNFFSVFPNSSVPTGLVNAKLNVNHATGESKCSGFLTFKSVEEADAILSNYSNPTLNGVEMIISEYVVRRENRIFLSSVPEGMDEQVLNQIAKNIGPVNHSYFSKNARVATIAFADPKDAEKALVLGWVTVEGVDVPIAPYINQADRMKVKKRQEAFNAKKKDNMMKDVYVKSLNDNSPVFVKNEKRTLVVADYPLTWKVDDLKGLFSIYGTITNVVTIKNSLSIIEFANEETVYKAASSMNNRVCNPYIGGKSDIVLSVDESKITLRRYQEKLIESKPIQMRVAAASTGPGKTILKNSEMRQRSKNTP